MLAIEPILDLVRAHRNDSHLTRVRLGDTNVCIGTRRLRTFADQGTTCLACGLKGQAFAVVPHRMPGAQVTTHHSLQLYGFADGERVWMTRDHIVARALGGLDTMHNSQPLCKRCNQRKGEQEGRVLAYLRQRCGLDALGFTPDGREPVLEQALIDAQWDQAWHAAQGQWDWRQSVPVEDQLDAVMGILPALPAEALAQWQDRLQVLAQAKGGLKAYRSHLNRWGKGPLTVLEQRDRVTSAALGLTVGGYVLAKQAWETYEADQAQARLREAAAQERALQAELEAQRPEAPDSASPASVVSPKVRQRATPEERLARSPSLQTHLAELQADFALISEAVGVTVEAYREECEARAVNAPVTFPVTAALAVPMGLSKGAMLVFLSDRATALHPDHGLANLRQRWADRHWKGKRLSAAALDKRLARLTDLAQAYGLTEEAYRAACEAKGVGLTHIVDGAQFDLQAHQLGLTLAGLTAFNEDFGNWNMDPTARWLTSHAGQGLEASMAISA